MGEAILRGTCAPSKRSPIRGILTLPASRPHFCCGLYLVLLEGFFQKIVRYTRAGFQCTGSVPDASTRLLWAPTGRQPYLLSYCVSKYCQAGNWGERWDSNPRQPESQSQKTSFLYTPMHAKSLSRLVFLCMAVYQDTIKMHPRYGRIMAECLWNSRQSTPNRTAVLM